MRHTPALLLACALAGAVYGLAEPASALSCAAPDRLLVPVPNATEVATNTLVWCTRQAAVTPWDVTLTAADGTVVSGTQTQISSLSQLTMVFRPSAELAPSTQYRVECADPLSADAAEYAFTTGTGPRQTAPAVPRVGGMQVVAEPDSGWGPAYFAVFDRAAEVGNIVVVDLDRFSTLETDGASGPSGRVSAAERMWQELWLGYGPCGGNWYAGAGASAEVRLGAFDLTGAFSGWSESVRVSFPAPAPPVAPAVAAGNTPSVVPDDSRPLPSGSPPVPEGPGTEVVRDIDAGERALNTGGCQLGGASGSPGAAALLLGLAGSALAARASRRRASRR